MMIIHLAAFTSLEEAEKAFRHRKTKPRKVRQLTRDLSIPLTERCCVCSHLFNEFEVTTIGEGDKKYIVCNTCYKKGNI